MSEHRTTERSIVLTEAQYSDLCNLLIWADLYDMSRNEDRNRKVLANIRAAIPYHEHDGSTPSDEERVDV